MHHGTKIYMTMHHGTKIYITLRTSVQYLHDYAPRYKIYMTTKSTWLRTTSVQNLHDYAPRYKINAMFSPRRLNRNDSLTKVVNCKYFDFQTKKLIVNDVILK